ncbi:type II toxin-antitoxin system RelE family toxin [Sodalis sp. RH21]|uniref:type II toxin-antitoxin system RelE family toxin n=1 Tax=unclassified Sodalis (in: enterobacteria) TaxID=2636512 RepID=UPI0039B452AC
MIYELEFEEHALKEFKKLGAPLREQFKKKLKEILVNPHIPANRLSGMPDCYKIKLRSAGYRLVYQAIDEEVIVLVLAVGKRERSEVYNAAKARL